MLLALDTCTERMIVATSGPAGDRWVNADSQGNHARDILLAVESLLGGNRPDAVGVALGPGSFTGVRIGLATAKGLAEGWKVPLVGLDNLEAMASACSQLLPQSRAAILPVIDARKQKFYAGLYRGAEVLFVPADRSASAWLEAVSATGPVIVSGYQGKLLAAALGDSLPSDWMVLETRDWAPGLLDQLRVGWKNQRFLPADAAPRYLRLSEAEENLQKRRP